MGIGLIWLTGDRLAQLDNSGIVVTRVKQGTTEAVMFVDKMNTDLRPVITRK